nr:uncharacterized protein LOC129270511 [Lytechinus pictus]
MSLNPEKMERHAKKAKDDPLTKANVAVLDLHQAEIEILKHVQREAFGDEIQILKSIQNDQGLTERKRKRQIKKASRLHGLDAFLDKDDILRPHGRSMGAADHSIRSVLDTLLYQSGRQLDDESLRTLMCEAAAIINSRPLTVTHLNDPTYPAPLTPNHLITMKSKVFLPPPGNFQNADIYSRKRWRRVQHLINEFWSRWRKEFLQNLQVRQKWTRPQREACVGDIVILKDNNTPRNQWPLARVAKLLPSEDGHIRKVKLTLGDPGIGNSGKRKGPLQELERPIHKLVLLLHKKTNRNSRPRNLTSNIYVGNPFN